VQPEPPFEDVRMEDGGFSIPERKWRELLFVGAMRREGDTYVRDAARPLPPFRVADLFPEEIAFAVERVAGRVRLRRV
jgi:hypothetical protein